MGWISLILVETLAAAVLLVPVLLVLCGCGYLKRKYLGAYLILGCYLAAMLALVGMPNITYVRFDLNLQLIPFAGIREDFRNACLNVLLFVPLGVLVPLLWEKYRRWRNAVLLGMLLSCGIEFIQIFTFRATDVNDVITNSLGTLVGFLLAQLVSAGFTRFTAREAPLRDLRVLYTAVLAVMFFGHPFMSMLLWQLR